MFFNLLHSIASCARKERYLAAKLLIGLGSVFPLLLGPSIATAANVSIFSASPLYRTPETISPAPAGFGDFGGQYFIPDFNLGNLDGDIWVVPVAGGPPTSFAKNSDLRARSGLFLPDSGWGENSGRFLNAGTSGPDVPTLRGRMRTFAADASSTLFLDLDNTSFAQVRIAPAGFGAFGGQLVVANTVAPASVLAVDPDAAVSTVATLPLRPFGLAFAPDGFGAFGGKLFASSADDGRVVTIDPDGTVAPFADIPLAPGQASLFQMEFSPAGFLPGFDELLFVSVRGSTGTGGASVLGDVAVLDSDGNLVARLRDDLGLTKFDPRGLFFPSNSQLLISDISDPILLVENGAFQVIPEPSAVALLGMGAAALALLFWKRMWRPSGTATTGIAATRR